jgi:hypothetical protein
LEHQSHELEEIPDQWGPFFQVSADAGCTGINL